MIHTTSSVRKWGCKRRYRHEYVDLVRPRMAGRALLLGSAVHVGLERYWMGEPIEDALKAMGSWTVETSDCPEFWDSEAGRIEMERACAILIGYCAKWGPTRSIWHVIEVESEFTMELAPGVTYAGKIDVIARDAATGKHYVIDHKTTSDEISTTGGDYFQHLALDLQVAAYVEAVRQKYGEVPGVLWDVIKKPQSRGPKCKEIIRRRKDEPDESVEARKAACMESTEEWGERIRDEILEDLDQFFVRREIFRTREQHELQLAELIETCREIQKYEGTYPRNDALCVGRYSTCPYLGVCSGVDTLDGEQFAKVESPHTELEQRAA